MIEQAFPDFLKLQKNYHHKLTNGQRADLRRVAEPDGILDIPAFYSLIQGSGLTPGPQAGRIVYFLPHVGHRLAARPIGRQMAEQKISETRLFQVIRAEFPDDLVYLRRLSQQMKVDVDWQEFGKMLYYWGKNSKRRMLQDYCLQPEKKSKNK